MHRRVRYLAEVGLFAAAYAALTVAFAPISYGLVQVRVSEMLTTLPYVFPSAIPGLFLGCVVANVYGGLGLYDIVFGSLATLVAAWLTARMPRPWLAPVPPVVVNAAVVGAVLHYVLRVPLVVAAAYVAAGEVVSAYVFGYVLLLAVLRVRRRGRRR